MDTLGGQHNIKLNDAAIENARKEIDRLRDQMRKDLSVDVNADTRAAQRRISQLQRSINTLDAESVDIPVDMDSAHEAESSINAVGGSIKGVLGLVAGAEVGRWLLDGATGASTFETNMRAVAAVLDDVTRIEVEDWISDNADAMNLSQVAASDLARSLALSASKFQAAGGDAGEFLTTLEGVTAEAAAFSHADPGEVAAAIGAAFRGEFDSLETFGINLNAALVQSQALKDGLVGVGEQMTPAIQTQATYNAILEQSGPLMGSVGRNSDTLGGKLSDLNQNVDDLSKSVGESLGPALEGIADIAIFATARLNDVIGKWQEFRNTINTSADDDVNRFDDFVDFLTGSLPEMAAKWNEMRENAFGAEGQIDSTGKSVTALDFFVQDLTGDLGKEGAAQVAAAEDTAQHAGMMERLAEKTSDAQGKFEELRDSFTAYNDAVIEARTHVFDYQGAIDDLAESLVKGGGVFAPDLEAGRHHMDNLVGFAEAASERVKDTWRTKGKDAATALQGSFRDTLHTMLTDAHVNSDRAWTLVNQVMGKPHQINLELGKIDTSKLEAQRARLLEQRATIKANIDTDTITPRAIDDAALEVQRKLKPINVKIKAINEDLKGPKGELDDAANPKGKPRKAHIDAKVDPRSVNEANADLDGIIKLRRTAKIQVEVIPPAVGQFFGLSAPSAGPTVGPAVGATSLRTASAAVMSAPVTTVAALPGRQSQQQQPERTRLAPKSTPVAVYLDGVEIAHRIEARRASAATESVRRSA